MKVVKKILLARNVVRSTKKRSTKKRNGRKSQSSTNLTNDLIDIIPEDDRLKEKLLMTMLKTAKTANINYEKVIKELKERCQARDEVFEYDVKQTREKFKSAALEFVRMQQ